MTNRQRKVIERALKTQSRFIELSKDEQRVTRFTSHRNTMKRIAEDRESRHIELMTRLGHGEEID
jgi:hypothetical protein